MSAQLKPAETAQFGLESLTADDMPAGHPVRLFADRYAEIQSGNLLPHENELLEDPELQHVLDWAQHLEPVEVGGAVDFYVLSQGLRAGARDQEYFNDGWMSETLDPEFAESRYHEVIAASVLRTPMYSKGATPSRERAFRMVLRGVFPVFADNRPRLRLIIIAAEPFISLAGQ